MRGGLPQTTFTGRVVEENGDRRQVHSFVPPHPMQKNRWDSRSKATGSPQPQACGVRARVAWTRGAPPRSRVAETRFAGGGFSVMGSTFRMYLGARS